MVEIEDIKDRKTLEAYLKMQSREVSVAFAVRSALRLSPLLSELTGKKPFERLPEELILALKRGVLTSLIDCVGITIDGTAAFHSSASAYVDASTSSTSEAVYAAYAAAYTSSHEANSSFAKTSKFAPTVT